MAKLKSGRGWAIVVDGRALYVDRLFATEREAAYERDQLLRHFPPDNPWHKRLTVDYWSEKESDS